ASRESSFFPMVDAVKRAVPPGASALVLVAETDAIDGLVSALDAQDSQIMRHPLTSDQAKELADAAAG
ncbi:MAG: DUF1269 domain-containing protein, partial [Thermoleophilia bacterium]|nr:DUF1269 domain-containing protein [Thermoleophilia bacterium]